MDYFLNVIIPYNVGQISQKKVEALKECFFEKYPNGLSIQDQFLMTNNSDNIVLAPSQITFAGPNRDFEELENEINKVFDIMLLNEELPNITIDFQHKQKFDGDFMEHSRKQYTNACKDSIGTGLRSFFMYRERLCEFKVEPLLADNNYIFCQGIYNAINEKTTNIKNLLSETFDDYTKKISGIL